MHRPPPCTRRALLGLLATTCLSACRGADSAPPSAPPRLHVEQPAYDFGRLPQGAPIEHAFTVYNRGGAPLTIRTVRSACECEVTIEGASDVPPGASTAVRARCRTDASAGPQRRTVTVYSNDPDTPAALLLLTGTVALEAVAEPAQVYLGTVPPGASAVRQVALRSGSDNLRFVGARSDAAQLSVRLVDTPEGRALALGTAPDAAPGPFDAVVHVYTTAPTRPVVDVRVAGIIGPPAAGGTTRAPP